MVLHAVKFIILRTLVMLSTLSLVIVGPLALLKPIFRNIFEPMNLCPITSSMIWFVLSPAIVLRRFLSLLMLHSIICACISRLPFLINVLWLRMWVMVRIVLRVTLLPSRATTKSNVIAEQLLQIRIIHLPFIFWVFKIF